MLFVSARGRPCRGTDHGYQARLSIVVQMLSLTGLHVVTAPLEPISQTMIGDACRSIRRALRIDSTRLNVLEQQQTRGGGAWGFNSNMQALHLLENMSFRVCVQ